MGKNIAPPVMAGIIALVLVLILGVGWFFINREPQPVASGTKATPMTNGQQPGGQEAGTGKPTSGGQLQQPRTDDP